MLSDFAENLSKFGEDVYKLMEKNKNSLSCTDLDKVRLLCDFYEKVVIMNNFTKKIKEYCKDKKYSDLNATVTLFEIFDNTNIKNIEKKDKIVNVNLQFINQLVNMSFETTEEFSEDGINKYLFYSIYIDGRLIIKKENKDHVDKYINLNYIKNIINANKLDISIVQFLEIFTFTFNISHFNTIIQEISLNVNKYCNKNEYSLSDSDISLTSDEENDEEKQDNEEKQDYK